jgi:hypothetical protein
VSNLNGGGPAFSRAGFTITGEDYDEGDKGMSLRDWFAGQAMIGFISNSDIPDLLRGGFKPEGAADACYMIADAMLKARQS